MIASEREAAIEEVEGPLKAAAPYFGAVLALGGGIAMLPGAWCLLMDMGFRNPIGGITEMIGRWILPFVVGSPLFCLLSFGMALGSAVGFILRRRKIIGLAALTWLFATVAFAYAAWFFAAFLESMRSLGG